MQLKNFQALRAVACIYVCLQHVTVFNRLGYGAIGVDIFFVLSGFLTIRGMVQRIENNTPITVDYLKNKFLNIIPLYWGVTMMIFFVGLIVPRLFTSLSFTLKNLVYSLLLIPGHTFFVYPAWTLTYMYIFWIIMYLVFRSCQSNWVHGTLISCIIICTLVTIGQIVGDYGVGGMIKAYFPPELLEFMYGILIYFAADKYKDKINGKFDLMLKIVASMTTILLFFFDWKILEYRFLVPAFVVCFDIVIIYWIQQIKVSRAYDCIVAIGDISFTIYIIHPLVIRPIDKIILSRVENISLKIIVIVLSVILTIVIAFLVNRCFEKPLCKFLKRNR